MKKSAPQNIVDMLMVIISRNGGNQLRASEFIGLSDSYVSQIIRGDRCPSSRAMKQIEEAYLRSGMIGLPKIKTEARMVPLVSFAAAGAARDYQDLATQIDELVETTSKDPGAFGLIIEGDSMENEFYPGDKVVFEPNRRAISGDSVVAKTRTGEGVLFKWLKREGQEGKQIVLKSENSNYSDISGKEEDFLFIYPSKNFIRATARKRFQ
jgi:SOS-response transcriptional repressor LexA